MNMSDERNEPNRSKEPWTWSTYLINDAGDRRSNNEPPPQGTYQEPQGLCTDYSDPRDFYPANEAELEHVWRALEPTLKSYSDITGGERLQRLELRDLDMGYNAAWNEIKRSLVSWIFATHAPSKRISSTVEPSKIFVQQESKELSGYSENVKMQITGTKVARENNPLRLQFFNKDGDMIFDPAKHLFKLERWYGLIWYHRWAPNWPGSRPRKRDSLQMAQNPEAFACDNCIKQQILCHGHREHVNRKCTPCEKLGFLCSKELFLRNTSDKENQNEQSATKEANEKSTQTKVALKPRSVSSHPVGPVMTFSHLSQQDIPGGQSTVKCQTNRELSSETVTTRKPPIPKSVLRDATKIRRAGQYRSRTQSLDTPPRYRTSTSYTATSGTDTNQTSSSQGRAALAAQTPSKDTDRRRTIRERPEASHLTNLRIQYSDIHTNQGMDKRSSPAQRRDSSAYSLQYAPLHRQSPQFIMSDTAGNARDLATSSRNTPLAQQQQQFSMQVSAIIPNAKAYSPAILLGSSSEVHPPATSLQKNIIDHALRHVPATPNPSAYVRIPNLEPPAPVSILNSKSPTPSHQDISRMRYIQQHQKRKRNSESSSEIISPSTNGEPPRKQVKIGQTGSPVQRRLPPAAQQQRPTSNQFGAYENQVPYSKNYPSTLSPTPFNVRGDSVSTTQGMPVLYSDNHRNIRTPASPHNQYDTQQHPNVGGQPPDAGQVRQMPTTEFFNQSQFPTTQILSQPQQLQRRMLPEGSRQTSHHVSNTVMTSGNRQRLQQQPYVARISAYTPASDTVNSQNQRASFQRQPETPDPRVHGHVNPILVYTQNQTLPSNQIRMSPTSPQAMSTQFTQISPQQRMFPSQIQVGQQRRRMDSLPMSPASAPPLDMDAWLLLSDSEDNEDYIE